MGIIGLQVEKDFPVFGEMLKGIVFTDTMKIERADMDGTLRVSFRPVTIE